MYKIERRFFQPSLKLI